jgi:superfamily II DNA helicase RecQ
LKATNNHQLEYELRLIFFLLLFGLTLSMLVDFDVLTQLAGLLQRDGIDAKPYHAKMSDTERSEVSKCMFVLNSLETKFKVARMGLKNVSPQVLTSFFENKVSVVVATIAFGMGIDKSDVRFVVRSFVRSSVRSFFSTIS